MVLTHDIKMMAEDSTNKITRNLASHYPAIQPQALVPLSPCSAVVSQNIQFTKLMDI